MDGYTVEQGKNIGAEYLFKGRYSIIDKTLLLSFYSVQKGVVVANDAVPFKRNIWGFQKFSENVKKAVGQMINKEFPIQIPVLRVLEGKSKAKVVLIAGGSSHNFKKKMTLDVFSLEQETVGDKKLTRSVRIGEVQVIEVENENFSKCKVSKGNKEIKELLSNGQKLYVNAYQNN